MKKILATAYDIDPYKGSESATGWNFIYQISRFNKVIAITRKNNKASIDRYIEEFNIDTSNMQFYYYDLPYWMRFWKKGARGSSLYFYLWQMFMPIFIKVKKIDFDIAHNVNFHTDAFPTFLWMLSKPTVWGTINHNEKIPSQYLSSNKAIIKENIKWNIKKLLWNFDIFIFLARKKSTIVLGGNSSVQLRLKIKTERFISLSQVGSIENNFTRIIKNKFNILVVGRFLTIKSFDIAIKSFAKFLNNNKLQNDISLTIVGKGPKEKELKLLVRDLYIEEYVVFIDWIDKKDLDVIYQNSSLFLFPSHEGAGMVVVEALSFGLPVVCFNNYGPGELVDDSCGIRIDYSSYETSVIEFSEALQELYKNKEKYLQLSDGAIQKFKKEYEWNQKGLKLKDIYNGIEL
ncbi:MAG TPA: glycosyltransferase [Arcobacter sp.]|nr:glycosyltransferase [Arcobacter sp.]